jgi:hypothetical protein
MCRCKELSLRFISANHKADVWKGGYLQVAEDDSTSKPTRCVGDRMLELQCCLSSFRQPSGANQIMKGARLAA